MAGEPRAAAGAGRACGGGAWLRRLEPRRAGRGGARPSSGALCPRGWSSGAGRGPARPGPAVLAVLARGSFRVPLPAARFRFGVGSGAHGSLCSRCR